MPGPDYGAFLSYPAFCDLEVLRRDFADFAWLLVCVVVWCWGWDGAGDLDGPDVDPIWERMSNRSTTADSVRVRHHRDLQYV